MRAVIIGRNCWKALKIKKLRWAYRCGIAFNVLVARLALHQCFSAKHEGCGVRVRMRAPRNKGIGVTREDPSIGGATRQQNHH